MIKYENGYWNKISYWQYKVDKAIKALDVKGVEYATSKLTYFMNRQMEVYG